MTESRRRFLQVLGAGLLLPALPEISTLSIPPFDFLTLPGDDKDQIDETLDRLLAGGRTGNPFVANAQVYLTEVGPQQLLDSPSALLNILDNLELGKSFSNRVSYREASQCLRHFQAHEAVWRGRFDSFTDVGRAPADRDVAYLVAGNITPNNYLGEAQGASQYRGNPAVALMDDDPGVVLAARSLLYQNYTPTQKELAQSLALTDRRPITLDDGQVGTRYETPVNSFVHVPRTRRANRTGRRSRGVVIAHNKRDRRNPNNLYYSGLYV